MNTPTCYSSETLHYATPAHGGWGVVRVGMLVPESQQLFICPFACGRHGAIGALQQQLKDRLHYLYVDQSDIIEGYDNLIVEQVPLLLASLEELPKVLLLFVSCLDDLIGTNHEAIIEELSSLYPQIDFRFCHMNPISLDSNSPPAVTIQRNMYSLLKPASTKQKTINAIGNLEAFDKDCELYHLLALASFRLLHISECTTYQEFQAMSQSSLNLVVGLQGVLPAEEMEHKLKIPALFAPVSYRWEAIEKNYERLAEQLGISICLEAYRVKTERQVQQTKAIVRRKPIIIDASATSRPFELARFLLEEGFQVAKIFVQKTIPLEKEHHDWILEKYPLVEVIPPLHPEMVKDSPLFPDSLAIGVEGAYLCKSNYPVDLIGDATLYGYRGLELLMQKMSEAIQNPRSLQQIIEDYKLVV